MIPLRFRGGLLSLGLGLVLQAGSARAGQLAVNPVQIKLDAEAPTELLSLRNNGTSPARYEIHAFAWSETSEGELRLAPTDEVLVFPPVLSLAPGELRNVRIGTLAAPSATERSFRIILDEMPPAVRPAGVAVFLNRISIPIFVATGEPRVSTSVEPLPSARGAPRFRLRNNGNVHVRPESVSAVALDARGVEVARKTWNGWYVLPDGERVYSLDGARGACASLRSLEVTVRTEGRDQRRVLALPLGACGT